MSTTRRHEAIRWPRPRPDTLWTLSGIAALAVLLILVELAYRSGFEDGRRSAQGADWSAPSAGHKLPPAGPQR